MYRFRAGALALLIAVAVYGQWGNAYAQQSGSEQATPSELAEINAMIDAMFNKSIALRDAGRYEEAARVAEALVEALKLAESEGGATASALQNLALIYQPMERHLEAEKLFQDSIAMAVRVLGPDDPDVAAGYGNLSNYYAAIQDFAKADDYRKRAIAVMEKAKGPDAPEVGVLLTGYGAGLNTRGRYADSEPIIRRSIKILANAPAKWENQRAAALANLAIIFKATGRFNEAEGLFKRAGVIWEQPQSINRKFGMENYANLGNLYRAMGRHAEAEQSYKAAVVLARQIFGKRHSSLVDPLGWLGDLYREQKRFREARKVYREVDAIIRAVAAKKDYLNGARHSLALLDIDEGRQLGKAESVILRNLPKIKAILGDHYSLVGEAYQYLGLVEESRKHWPEAAARFRQSIEIWKARSTTGPPATGGYETADTLNYRKALNGLIESLWQLQLARPPGEQSGNANPQGLMAEAFEIGQRALNSASAAALAQMAGRHASGDSEIAKLVRESQDLDQQWAALDRLLSKARAEQGSQDGAMTLQQTIDRVEARRKEIAATLSDKFPQEFELTRPAPLSLADVQRLLHAGEVLATFLSTDRSIFVWIVSHDDAGWKRLDIAPEELAARIRALRCGLDAAAWAGDGEKNCQNLIPTKFTAAEMAQGAALPFDLELAHFVYRQLLGPVEPLIKGKSIIVVPSGVLSLLPFQVLVTESPSASATGVADYRAAKWLGTQTAISVLPSVSGLRALRAFAKTSAAKSPFLGIGNPLLDGDPQSPSQVTRAKYARAWTRCKETIRTATLDTSRSGEIAMLGAGGLADVGQLRRQPPLPETANELCAVGSSLGVSGSALDANVRLGPRATESEIRALSSQSQLATYRIVHFATHAALSGQVRGSAEPGLILTPPATASADDDGYLSATDVSQLKLDADWVILSACNTAGGSSIDSSALSGLARAFLYAGARSLLVSHWAVNSVSTVKLITLAFAHLSSDPKLGRAAALQLAMTDLIKNGAPDQAHPARWAPFVLVGEGARIP